MDQKVELHRSYMGLLQASSNVDRDRAAQTLRDAASAFAMSYEAPPSPEPSAALKRDEVALTRAGEQLDALDDVALATFNRLLPWAAMTIDRRGRTVGSAWSASKRPSFNALIDRRLSAFDAVWPLRGRHILEVGCFEGIHTLGCLILGAEVTGVDGRVENIVKTMARLWAYGRTTPLILWDLETPPPVNLPASWDMLHHVGVLYHLSNPVEHLDLVLPKTTGALLLDTHVARSDREATSHYEVDGRTYRYERHGEAFSDVSPFAGLRDHAKWLRVEDLHDRCRTHGFKDVRTVEDRDERNGRRVLIRAIR